VNKKRRKCFGGNMNGHVGSEREDMREYMESMG